MERERETERDRRREAMKQREKETSVPAERKQEGREGKEKRAVSREEQEVAEAENDGRRGTRPGTASMPPRVQTCPDTFYDFSRFYLSSCLFFPRICAQKKNLKDFFPVENGEF